MQTKNITRIVLTGGPCAGKTTALERIRECFTNLGFMVFTVPEVPTMVTQIGWNYLTDNKDFYFQGEKMILEMQIALEDKIYEMAKTIADKPCLVVGDRGLMDISTYVSEEMWQRMCDEVGMPSDKMRMRYDAVIHLMSAANGTEECYTTANNAQRYEQADEAGMAFARELDQRQLKAWEVHPEVSVVVNDLDFEAKMQEVLKAVGGVLGVEDKI